MKIQVLVATMNQPHGDYSLLEKMNIQTDAIICNQCDRNEFESFYWNSHFIRWLSFSERGVGLNRNNALMRATEDIVVFADDDMVYVDGYESIIVSAFSDNIKADVIAFNIGDPKGKRKQNSNIHRVGWMNYLRYGTARIAAKTASIKINGIYFNQCFGGGTEYSHGEDNLFLTECLKKGLRIYAYPESLATLTEERESSWDSGDNRKYLLDQGVLYKQISKKWFRLLCFQDAIRRHSTYGISWKKAYEIMLMGAKY